MMRIFTLTLLCCSALFASCIDVPPPPETCDDSLKNGLETDVDCGGEQCGLCPNNNRCQQAADCQSGQCSNGVCISCDDSLKNGLETDVDCGGAQCGPCPDEAQCEQSADCQSGQCSNGSCISCDDGLKNGLETDVDCGGDTCDQCPNDALCEVAADCTSGLCTNGVCIAPSCRDEVVNGQETDVDCGGALCAACRDGASCREDNDCLSETCIDGICTNPEANCENMTLDGAETDVDCGGPLCMPCADGLACAESSDCSNGVCSDNICVVSSCMDGVQNGDETDIDCGGADCPRCGLNQGCNTTSDCGTQGACVDGSCDAPSCTDGLLNQDETDVDCGGGCPGACPHGSRCEELTDCSEACDAGVCVARHCIDDVVSGTETHIDCGGPNCRPCGAQGWCLGDEDCLPELSCIATRGHRECAPLSCTDGQRTPGETDIDCGGRQCPKCPGDAICINGIDCIADSCLDENGFETDGIDDRGVCADYCLDRVHNGDETSIDCGGSTCERRCTVGSECLEDSDCEGPVEGEHQGLTCQAQEQFETRHCFFADL